MEFNAKQLSQEWKEELRKEIESFPTKPVMAVIIAKDYSEASKKYVANKIKTNEELGIETELFEIEYQDKSHDELLKELTGLILVLNSRRCINGIIVQKPFPQLIDHEIDNLIDVLKDIDGFSCYQKGALVSKMDNVLAPATALGCSKIISKVFNGNVSGLNAVIINRSGLIGLPLQSILLYNNCTVTNIHTKTNEEYKNLLLKNADIVITGCGQRKIFNSSHFSNKCKLIIDCSMTKVEGILGVGDLDKEQLLEHRPDIVVSSGYNQSGLLTVTALANNLVQAYKAQNNF